MQRWGSGTPRSFFGERKQVHRSFVCARFALLNSRSLRMTGGGREGQCTRDALRPAQGRLSPLKWCSMTPSCGKRRSQNVGRTPRRVRAMRANAGSLRQAQGRLFDFASWFASEPAGFAQDDSRFNQDDRFIRMTVVVTGKVQGVRFALARKPGDDRSG